MTVSIESASEPESESVSEVSAPQPADRTGGRILIDQLLRHGVDTAYGVPGESYLAALDALHDAPLHLVVCRHEGGACYMAEAYGKLTGRPGVCFVTRGPGASNAMVGVQTAHHDGTPLVLFVGLVPRGHTDRAAFQEIDLRAMFGSTAKLVQTIEDAARIPEYVARAFAVARSGRPGPVVIGLPEDMLTDVARVADATPAAPPEGAVSEGELARLGELLAGAERPVALLGGGAWTPQAKADVREWAEAWQLPVVVDFRCQDRIDNDSPVYAGHLGYGRAGSAADRLRIADLVIAIGTAPGDVPTDGFTLLPTDGSGPRLVQALPEAQPPGLLYAPDLALLATPEAVGRALRGLRPDGRALPWAVRTKGDRAACLAHRAPLHDDDPLDLGAVFAALEEGLPADAIVTVGAGNHAIWVQRFLKYGGARRLLGPRNGSMGYGIPAAVAAAIAEPDRQVVSVSGDGCFLMNGQELATAVAEGARPLILVLNNAGYGTIRAHQERRYPGRVSGTGLVNPDFAGYARAFGAHGETVTRTEEFAPALRRALDSGTAALIELKVASGRLSPGVTVTDLRERATGRE